MRKRRKYVVLVVVALVAVGLGVAIIPSREPSYGGKRLSEWVAGGGPLKAARDEAIRTIGTNAIPYLVEWISYERSTLEATAFRAINEVAGRINSDWEIEDKKFNRAICAVSAFRALGAAGAGAIPELCRIVDNPNVDDWSAQRAVRALAFLGNAGVAALAERVTDQQERVRAFNGAQIIFEIGSSGTNVRTAVPILIGFLNANLNRGRAAMAASALGMFKMDPSITLPALTNSFGQVNARVREAAAEAVGGFGQDARSTVPALLNLLRDPNYDVRKAATNALFKIDPQALQNAPGH